MHLDVRPASRLRGAGLEGKGAAFMNSTAPTVTWYG
jgi:hypothetical protein